MLTRKTFIVLLSLVLVLSIGALSGCGGKTEPVAEDTGKPAEEVPSIDEAAEIIKVTDDYVSSEFSKTWLINAPDLYEKVFNEKEESFQLVDVRTAEHYAKGHIEGAINIPFESIVDEANLAKLDQGKTQILIDYRGATATAAHMFLTQLGYEVLTLRYGMNGWTTDPAVAAADGLAVWDGKGMDYPTTTETFTVEAAFEVPKVSTGAKDGREAIINSAKAYIASGGPTVIPVTKFKEIVDSKDDSYQIVALVAPDHFALGHPAGAFNIPRAKIAKEEALKKLDPDKTVLLYCYQGHNSGLVSMFLGQLGYDVVSAQYGLSAWTNNKEIRAVETYNPGKVKNFATVQ